MSYLVFAVGLLLAIFGAASISFGYGIIDVERGWASVIAGAVALSGGIVTVALGMILYSLSGLRALLRAERDARTVTPPPLATGESATEPRIIEAPQPQVEARPSQDAAIGVWAEETAEAVMETPALVFTTPPAAADPGPPAEPTAAAVAYASIEDVRRVVAQTNARQPAERRVDIESFPPAADSQGGALEPPSPSTPVEAPARRKGPPPFGLPRALDLNEISPQHFGATSTERRPTARSVASAAEPPMPPLVPRPQTPPSIVADKGQGGPPRRSDDRTNVIGRYESEGTTYVMFADGSIDASSELGAFRFSSMAELKAFMETQTRSES